MKSIVRDYNGWSARGTTRKGIPAPPIRSRTVATWAWAKAEQMPDAIACQFNAGPALTYGQAAIEARKLASALQKLGLSPGETVSFQLPNWREAVIINIAAAALGLIVNPVPPIYRGAELRHILSDSRAKLIFIPDRYRAFDYEQMLNALRPLLPDLRHVILVGGSGGTSSYKDLIDSSSGPTGAFPKVDTSSVKLLLYTSGTTGRAKGVLHTHATSEYANRIAIDTWKLGRGDIMLMPSPITHITGYGLGLELPFGTDVGVAFIDRWDASQAVPYINRVGASACVGATPFLKELVDEAERQNSRLPSLRLFACGGASASADLILRTAHVTEQCRATRVYGATEVPLVTKGFTGAEQLGLAADTDGKVIGYEVKVVDSSGACLPHGIAGEILVRGPSMMIGYTDPEETEKAFDDDGFFKTGDIGVLTAEGAIVITARLKDLIIRGGENLSPKEIEDALARHPAIAEAAVVAMPHPRLGEGVCAFLGIRPGAEAPSLMDIAEFLEREGLARQKFPERVEYISDFPRTPSGKVRKDILRDAVKQHLVVRLAP